MHCRCINRMVSRGIAWYGVHFDIGRVDVLCARQALWPGAALDWASSSRRRKDAMDVKMPPKLFEIRVGFVSGCSASSTGASSGPPTATSEEALKYTYFFSGLSCSARSFTSQIQTNHGIETADLVHHVQNQARPDRGVQRSSVRNETRADMVSPTDGRSF